MPKVDKQVSSANGYFWDENLLVEHDKQKEKEKVANRSERVIDTIAKNGEVAEMKEYLQSDGTNDKKAIETLVNTPNEFNYVPLHYAYERALINQGQQESKLKMLRYLLGTSVNADPNIVNPTLNVPVLFDSQLYQYSKINRDIFSLLLTSSKLKLKFNRRFWQNGEYKKELISVLHLATQANLHLYVGLLLNYITEHELDYTKSAINRRDNDGKTPIYYAIYNRNHDMAKLLFKKGAIILKDANSMSLLIQQSHLDLKVKRFLFEIISSRENQVALSKAASLVLPHIAHARRSSLGITKLRIKTRNDNENEIDDKKVLFEEIEQFNSRLAAIVIINPDITNDDNELHDEPSENDVFRVDSDEYIALLMTEPEWYSTLTKEAVSYFLGKSDEERKRIMLRYPVLFKHFTFNFFKHIMCKEDIVHFKRMVLLGNWLWAKMHHFLEKHILNVFYLTPSIDCSCLERTGFQALDYDQILPFVSERFRRLRTCNNNVCKIIYKNDDFLDSVIKKINNFCPVMEEDVEEYLKSSFSIVNWKKSPLQSLLLWSILSGRYKLTTTLFYSTDFNSIPLNLVAILAMKLMSQVDCPHRSSLQELQKASELRLIKYIDSCFRLENKNYEFAMCSYLNFRLPKFGNLSCVDLASKCDNNSIISAQPFQEALNRKWNGVLGSQLPFAFFKTMVFGLCLPFNLFVLDSVLCCIQKRMKSSKLSIEENKKVQRRKREEANISMSESIQQCLMTRNNEEYNQSFCSDNDFSAYIPVDTGKYQNQRRTEQSQKLYLNLNDSPSLPSNNLSLSNIKIKSASALILPRDDKVSLVSDVLENNTTELQEKDEGTHVSDNAIVLLSDDMDNNGDITEYNNVYSNLDNNIVLNDVHNSNLSLPDATTKQKNGIKLETSKAKSVGSSNVVGFIKDEIMSYSSGGSELQTRDGIELLYQEESILEPHDDFIAPVCQQTSVGDILDVYDGGSDALPMLQRQNSLKSNESVAEQKVTFKNMFRNMLNQKIDSTDAEVETVKPSNKTLSIRKLKSYDWNTFWDVKQFYKTPKLRVSYHALSHIIFFILSSVVMAEEEHHMTNLEWFMYIFFFGFLLEEVMELFRHIAEKTFTTDYCCNKWNFFDWTSIVFFLISYGLRIGETSIRENTFFGLSFLDNQRELTSVEDLHEWMHLFRGLGLLCFGMRLLYLCCLSQHLGPKLYVSYLMFKHDLFPTLFILAIIIFAFGVFIEGILNPSHKGIMFLQGLFQICFYAMFGEYNLENIISEAPTQHNKTTRDVGGVWTGTFSQSVVVFIAIPVYVIFTQLLLLNLIIALFAKTVDSHLEHSKGLWLRKRYELIDEVKQHSWFPPPLNIIEIIYRFFYYSCCKVLHIRHLQSDKVHHDKQVKLGEELMEFEFHQALILRNDKDIAKDDVLTLEEMKNS